MQLRTTLGPILGTVTLMIAAAALCQQQQPDRPELPAVTVGDPYELVPLVLGSTLEPTPAVPAPEPPVILGSAATLNIAPPFLFNQPKVLRIRAGDVEGCAEWKLLEVITIFDRQRNLVSPPQRAFEAGSPPVPSPNDMGASGATVNRHAGPGPADPFLPGAPSGTPGHPIDVEQEAPSLKPGYWAVMTICDYCVAEPASPQFHKFLGCDTWNYDPERPPEWRHVEHRPTPSDFDRRALDQWRHNHGAF